MVLWSHVQARWAGCEENRRPGAAVEVVTAGVDRMLSRAVLTTASTVVPAATILAVGLTPLSDFARVMLAGTVAGTLSSMFVVGALAVRALEREAGVRARSMRAVSSAAMRAAGSPPA